MQTVVVVSDVSAHVSIYGYLLIERLLLIMSFVKAFEPKAAQSN